jgi:hypothetical protein
MTVLVKVTTEGLVGVRVQVIVTTLELPTVGKGVAGFPGTPRCAEGVPIGPWKVVVMGAVIELVWKG